MTAPVQIPTWATDGGASITDPGATKQGIGWIVEIPPHEYFNWWQNLVGQWIVYLNTELAAVQALQGIYDAIVGTGGTHADLNAVVAAMGVTLPNQDVKVFVKSPLTVIATQVLSKEGMDIEFHPKAFIAKGLTVVTGIQITAKRVKIKGGRFINFNEVGGEGIELTANGKNCHILNNTFSNCTDSVTDGGANNVLIGNIEEVA
jgi:hypothetical protein